MNIGTFHDRRKEAIAPLEGCRFSIDAEGNHPGLCLLRDREAGFGEQSLPWEGKGKPPVIKTSDEGTSYCPQCEAYAKEIAHLKVTRESLQKEVAGLEGNCQRWAEKVNGLEAVRKAAERIIHSPAPAYFPNSRKKALQAALDALDHIGASNEMVGEEKT